MPAFLKQTGDPEPILAHLESVPRPPELIARLFDDADGSAVTHDGALAVLRRDPALAARLLRISNGDEAAADPMARIEDLLARLGPRRMRGLLLAGWLLETFSAPERGRSTPTFDLAEHWKHALAAACGARRLAQEQPAADAHPDDAFVAGLVHDAGKVALNRLFPKSYDRIAALAETGESSWAQREREVLGIDHTTVGRRLLQRWGLPGWMADAAGLHHDPPHRLPADRHARLVGLARVASSLARRQRIGYSGNAEEPAPLREGIEELGVTPAMLEAVAARLADDVAAHTALLTLTPDTTEALYFKALARASAESTRIREDLHAARSHLADESRTLKAILAFDAALMQSADAAAAACALAAAGRAAFDRPVLACVTPSGSVAPVAGWFDPGRATSGTTQLTMDDELRAALDGLSRGAEIRAAAPAALLTRLSEQVAALGAVPERALAIRHESRLVALLLYADSAGSAGQAGDEARLMPLWNYLGSTLARIRSHAASVRVAGDLADANRRMQQMQTELLRTRTLSMIAEMAAGAGHELNNPLSVISGRAQMLLAQAADVPGIQHSLNVIALKAHECSRIVTELMDFARPPAPNFGEVNLAEAIGEACMQWREQGRIAGTRLTISPSVLPSADNPVVRADAAQMGVVLKELLQNATEAVIDNSGTIHVDLTVEQLPGEGPGERAARAAHIRIRDTGSGMPPNVLLRVFDPFFSHRKAGRGRGLGLPRAHRIVEAHDGRIWLDSTQGRGTTAHVVLPLPGGA